MNTTKITSFTCHQTAEGMRATFTYSVINESGQLLQSNVRATVIVMDDEINAAIADISTWLLGKVPAE